jgi:MinD superfamily P-loop ATPase
MYEIDQNKCSACSCCMDICEVGAIYLLDNKAQIEKNVCSECGACVYVCPNDAISVKHIRERQYPIVADSSPRQSIITALKSGIVAVGSSLLPLMITKVGDLLSAKLENVNRPASQPKQNIINSGRKGGRRSRGRGRKQR